MIDKYLKLHLQYLIKPFNNGYCLYPVVSTENCLRLPLRAYSFLKFETKLSHECQWGVYSRHGEPSDEHEDWSKMNVL